MRQYVGAGQGHGGRRRTRSQGPADARGRRGRATTDVFAEGVDNDGDGRVNEDGIGGLDLHRNYPENWRPMPEETGRGYTQGGAGAYPLSEPETRAVFAFLIRHPNVGVAQSLDTTVPMILRGPSTSKSEESAVPEDLEILRKFDQKGMEITGYPWAGDTYCVYANRGRGGRRAAARRGRPAALRPRAGLRLPLLRRHLVRRRDLERRPLARPTPTRTARPTTWNSCGGSTRTGRQGRLPAVDQVQASDARRRRDRRLQSEVLVAEPAARDARDLGAERGDVQPLPGAAARPGADRRGDVASRRPTARSR